MKSSMLELTSVGGSAELALLREAADLVVAGAADGSPLVLVVLPAVLAADTSSAASVPQESLNTSSKTPSRGTHHQLLQHFL